MIQDGGSHDDGTVYRGKVHSFLGSSAKRMNKGGGEEASNEEKLVKAGKKGKERIPRCPPCTEEARPLYPPPPPPLSFNHFL